jgi:hypothetical protein
LDYWEAHRVTNFEFDGMPEDAHRILRVERLADTPVTEGLVSFTDIPFRQRHRRIAGLLSSLPDEMIVSIFSRFTPEVLLLMTCVSMSLRRICVDWMVTSGVLQRDINYGGRRYAVSDVKALGHVRVQNLIRTIVIHNPTQYLF